MRKMCLLIAIAATLVAGVSSAAGRSSAAPCAGGTLDTGTYPGFTVTGTCAVPDGATVTIGGNLRIAAGATFDAKSLGQVTVDGNIVVGKGGRLELGCDLFAGSPCPESGEHAVDVVNGNVVANQPLTLRLNYVEVHGNVVSNGGGTGTDLFLNFPIKDNTIDGNLIIHGYRGGWLGVIRNHVHGNVDLSHIVSIVQPGPVAGVDTDSTEVQTNVIDGNLICHDNVPAAQVNPDHGGQPNSVGGRELGECAGL